MTPERLTQIREKNALSIAYLATQLEPAHIADTAFGHTAELLVYADELHDKLAAATRAVVTAATIARDVRENAGPVTKEAAS